MDAGWKKRADILTFLCTFSDTQKELLLWPCVRPEFNVDVSVWLCCSLNNCRITKMLLTIIIKIHNSQINDLALSQLDDTHLNIKDRRTWLLYLGCWVSFLWGDQIKKLSFTSMTTLWYWITSKNDDAFFCSCLIKMENCLCNVWYNSVF